MKANKGSIARAVDNPDRKLRFYLFHGQDEAQSRALAMRLAEALGASRTQLTSASIKSDPASLVDEASAMSLFGGERLIWVEPAGDDILAGVEALLEAPAVQSAVVAIAGALRKGSGLLKLAESSPAALAYAAYFPEGQDAERMIVAVGRRFGLTVDSALASRVAEACGNDQAVAARELEKLALYLGADPNAPKRLDEEALDAVGAESAQGDFLRLADLALDGRTAELTEELSRLSADGKEAVPVIRSLQRRLLVLAPLRARVEAGQRPGDVMASARKSLFWKDEAKVGRMLGRWSARELARLAERAGRLERDLMFTSAPAVEALGEELLAIARRAERR
ncbi:MAG TPA: DNA polymerase III subunit delta [Sphingomicrobium sp.]|nr:DNA polymerase III subunit delta [Sphingomicrobium sp.]